MVSGPIAIMLLVLAVLVLIYATSKMKMNAFVVLISIAFLYGVAIGMPLSTVVQTIKDGFGGTLGAIGIVIISGTIIGIILEKTGAAISITEAILKVVGKNRAPLAMSFTGWVVSIPVFCDSGFVILTPLNKALSVRAGKSMAVMSVALATGLISSHALVPPTPGPIAAAENLGADLGMVILFGLIVSFVTMMVGYFWALKVASKYTIEMELEESYEELVHKHGKLPGAFHSMLPLLIPILLILVRSISLFPTRPFGEGGFHQFIVFIGDPVTALILGVFVSLTLVAKGSRSEAVSDWMSQGVKYAALIIAITGAGGAFGRVLMNSPMGGFIEESMSGLPLGYFLPFLLAVAIKTSQGSGTVSLITTSAIMAPLLSTFGLNPALTVTAIGCGAIVVSHANDSYFWVVSTFSDMPVPLAYKIYTTSSLVQGVCGFLVVLLLSLFV
jgi:GntP family gluconate:H+ symporter